MNSPSDSPDAPARLTDRRVLIIEDHADVRMSLEQAFELEGATVLGCRDGKKGLALCEAERPDLVVLDMMLPKLSGYQVLEQIKLQDPPPRVIMVTANDGRSHEKYAEAIGADAYMRKPLSLDQVLETAVMLLKHVPGR